MRAIELKELLALGRFHFLAAGFLLFSAGALYAALTGAGIPLDRFALAYMVLLPGHLSVSYSNDYFDRETDRTGSPGIVSGGSGVLQRRPHLAGTARLIALMLIVVSLLLGFLYFLLYHPGAWFLPYVAAGNAIGWYYSAPPLRFVGTPFGELATALAIGLLVPGMGYIAVAGAPDTAFLLFAVPLFCYGYFFIITVEAPDVEADRRAMKWTLLARKGIAFGNRLRLLAAAIASSSLLLPWALGIAHSVHLMAFPLSLLPFLSALWALQRGCGDRDCVKTQACLNLSALVGFLLLFDLLALLHL